MNRSNARHSYAGRRRVLSGLFALCALALGWRVIDLQILSKDFLINHGDARALRVIATPAHRGAITDANGEPLAVSTPVASIWARPQQTLAAASDLAPLASLLRMDGEALIELLRQRSMREFVYLKRHVEPQRAQQILALKIPGVHVQREYKRYYPSGEVTAHLLGFTNVDDAGQEGLELAFDHWLKGRAGAKRVLKDRLGHIIKNIDSIRPARPGKTLTLSIDKRLQYLAYRELKAAVIKHQAKAGMLLLLDSETGEVLALAGQPSFNPNNRGALRSDHYRNRVVTDVFEPGSTMKPFTIAAALQSGLFTIDSAIPTAPGFFTVGEHAIRDVGNYGLLDMKDIIKKSSNVGAGKLALALGPQRLWRMHRAIGLGRQTGSGYPGEVAGLLNDYRQWSELELATISFGYGVSVTTLQLARAYSLLAADGLLRPVSFVQLDGHNTRPPVRVLPAELVRQIRRMMRAVVHEGGSGARAAVPGYQVAGKTGTVHKLAAAGYQGDKYLSLFAGMAPASRPRLVMVVVIDEPKAGQYFGGQVAAPVFSAVMKGALRLLNIPPDDIKQQRTLPRARLSPIMAENMAQIMARTMRQTDR